jgi:hypothetical protein
MLVGMETELAQRENNGIVVTLLWHSETNRLTVAVRDWHTSDAFELEAHVRNALDVFHHPYAYAARQGVFSEPVGEPIFA